MSQVRILSFRPKIGARIFPRPYLSPNFTGLNLANAVCTCAQKGINAKKTISGAQIGSESCHSDQRWVDEHLLVDPSFIELYRFEPRKSVFFVFFFTISFFLLAFYTKKCFSFCEKHRNLILESYFSLLSKKNLLTNLLFSFIIKPIKGDSCPFLQK